MSYQIKATPFFRRIYNTSKNNGQLQRLREEYERIQEFNDRTIEMKMRQVRLKRLFRHIEELNEHGAAGASGIGGGGGGGVGGVSPLLGSRQSHRRFLNDSPSMIERQQHMERVEVLTRARELGMEISRRNAEVAVGPHHHHPVASVSSNARQQHQSIRQRAAEDARREAADRRERAAKRISYGNAMSKFNMERLGRRQVRQVTRQHSNDNNENVNLMPTVVIDTIQHHASIATTINDNNLNNALISHRHHHHEHQQHHNYQHQHQQLATLQLAALGPSFDITMIHGQQQQQQQPINGNAAAATTTSSSSTSDMENLAIRNTNTNITSTTTTDMYTAQEPVDDIDDDEAYESSDEQMLSMMSMLTIENADDDEREPEQVAPQQYQNGGGGGGHLTSSRWQRISMALPYVAAALNQGRPVTAVAAVDQQPNHHHHRVSNAIVTTTTTTTTTSTGGAATIEQLPSMTQAYRFPMESRFLTPAKIVRQI